jgi:hypothetical protein
MNKSGNMAGRLGRRDWGGKVKDIGTRKGKRKSGYENITALDILYYWQMKEAVLFTACIFKIELVNY